MYSNYWMLSQWKKMLYYPMADGFVVFERQIHDSSDSSMMVILAAV